MCVCLNCLKESKEVKKQTDGDGIEINICPHCLSELIVEKSLIPLKQEALCQILKKYNHHKVLLIADLIDFQYKGQKIRNYQGLLISLLEKKSVIFPDKFVPYFERRKKQALKIKTSVEKREAEQKDKEKEKTKQIEAKKKFNSLSEHEKNLLLKKAHDKVPLSLQDNPSLVKTVAYTILMEEIEVQDKSKEG